LPLTEDKSTRLNDIYGHAETGRHSQYSARILRDIRLKQCQSHGLLIRPFAWSGYLSPRLRNPSKNQQFLVFATGYLHYILRHAQSMAGNRSLYHKPKGSKLRDKKRNFHG